MNAYEKLCVELSDHPRRWLVTGAAGFIGSNLVAKLLKLGQRVTGVDNFLTGSQKNLEAVRAETSTEQWTRFYFHEGDLRDSEVCRQVCTGVELILHQAALGSVPRSIARPDATNANNIDGFLNIQLAARDANVKAFVYASSSTVYGDHPTQPRREDTIGNPLSPYALTKRINELYAEVFVRCYDMNSIGLRYFNVFGPRQNLNGSYAAVIPQWITAMTEGRSPVINGDGQTSRDFCYVENVVQANLLAADWLAKKTPPTSAKVFNVATGSRTTLNELFKLLCDGLASHVSNVSIRQPEYGPFRAGDVQHSQADIRQIQETLGYHPSHDLAAGLNLFIAWHLTNNLTRQ